MKFLLKSMAMLLLVWPIYASEKDEQNASNSTMQLTILNSDEIHASLIRLEKTFQEGKTDFVLLIKIVFILLFPEPKI